MNANSGNPIPQEQCIPPSCSRPYSDHAFGNVLQSAYNCKMVQPTVFEEMLKYIGLSATDVSNIISLRDSILPLLEEVTEKFYEELLKNPNARAIFTGGDRQIAHQRILLTRWLSEVFDGNYGREYYEKRFQIGLTHMRVGLPQPYMCLGMQLIWQELDRVIRRQCVPQQDEKLASLHKILMFDLAVMLDSYTASYIEQTRNTERTVVEERLTKAEHLAEIGRLAASLAHEIKNPLAGISGAIQVIRDAMDSEDPKRPIIGEILAQIHRLDSAVRDLLLYARPNLPRKAEMSLTDAVHRVLMILAQEPAFQRVAVHFDGSTRNYWVLGDRNQIEQLLLNLLINAAQAAEASGRIRIAIQSQEGNVRLSVSDTGIGMTPEALGHAFEPFYTTKSRGTGLGLSICKRIAETHGGSIELTSAPGKGTTVTVHLPAPISPHSPKDEM